MRIRDFVVIDDRAHHERRTVFLYGIVLRQEVKALREAEFKAFMGYAEEQKPLGGIIGFAAKDDKNIS